MATQPFRPMAPRVPEQDSRKSNKFVASETIEPLNRVSRMKWLYNKVTGFSLDYEFSEPAREWLRQRVATEDVTSRRDRSNSIWWENSGGHKGSDTLGTGPDGDNGAPSNPEVGKQSVANAVQVSFEQVITSDQLTTDFRELLDDAIGANNVDFQETINALHQDVKDLRETGKKGDSDVLLYDRLLSVYSQFVNRDTAGDNLINISEQTRTNIANDIASVSKVGRGSNVSAYTSMYEGAIAEAKQYIYENLWPEFILNDDYQLLCQAYSESLEKQSSANSGNNKNYASINSYEYIRSVGLPSFSHQYGARAPNWALNNTTPFYSLTIAIAGGRGPMMSLKQANELSVCIGIGSFILHTRATSGAWSETVSLPITSNVQYAHISVSLQGKCIGFSILPIHELIQKPNGTSGACWYSLNTEDQPGELTLGPSNAQPTGRNEICFDYTFSSDKEIGSGNEKTKMVYPDETATGGFGDFIRGKVSKKKTRFTEDNFNLDLTYITPQVIAMGFPAEGTEGMYRNPLKQVQKFFLMRHPHAYRIYNLCSERAYDPIKFENNCQQFPFDDHNPPPFRLIKEFCEDAREFLSQSPQNVISVHCKAGKGRTGTMIASYFVYLGLGNANEALRLFGRMRTSNSKGVTIPSQIRYVHYFDHYCRLRRANKPSPGKTTLFLEKVILKGLKNQPGELFFTLLQPNKLLEETNSVVEETKQKFFTSRKLLLPVYNKNQDTMTWDLSTRVLSLCEDFRIEVYGGSSLSLAREKLFQCWLNTRFLQCEYSEDAVTLTVPKIELDKACKDKNHKKYTQDMYLQLVFSNVATATRIKAHELQL